MKIKVLLLRTRDCLRNHEPFSRYRSSLIVILFTLKNCLVFNFYSLSQVYEFLPVSRFLGPPVDVVYLVIVQSCDVFRFVCSLFQLNCSSTLLLHRLKILIAFSPNKLNNPSERILRPGITYISITSCGYFSMAVCC